MTYAIIARDPVSGQIGAAVQSHFFNAGPVVLWAEEGVGIVATMAVAEAEYGRGGLSLLRSGVAPDAALSQLLGRDPYAAVRQVGILGAAGSPVAHTGAACVPAAGHRIQEDLVTLGNLLTRHGTWDAMAEAFSHARGSLASRLLAALYAAEAHGGDLRGMQSAAVKVVSSSAAGGSSSSVTPGSPVSVDLRVDDSAEPLSELSRLLSLQGFYEKLLGLMKTPGIFSGDYSAAAVERAHAQETLRNGQALLGDNKEPSFWQAILAVRAGEMAQARDSLAVAVASNPRWSELAGRVAALGMISPEALQALDLQAFAPHAFARTHSI